MDILVSMTSKFTTGLPSDLLRFIAEMIILGLFLPWVIARRQRRELSELKSFLASQIRDTLSAHLLGIDGSRSGFHLEQLNKLIEQASFSLDPEARKACIVFIGAFVAYSGASDSRAASADLKLAFADLLSAFGIRRIDRLIAIDRIAIALQYRRKEGNAA